MIPSLRLRLVFAWLAATCVGLPACNKKDSCPDGSWGCPCVNGGCAAGNFCAPDGSVCLRHCTSDPDCAAAGLVCDVGAQTCTYPSSASCPTDCAASGLVCDATTLTCVAPAASCPTDCAASGLVCDATTLTCVAPAGGSGPRILSLSGNVATLPEGDPLTLTVLATDPDGIDDLIGGLVMDPDTGAAYGALQTSASEGSYSLTLSWTSIIAVRAIDGAVPLTRVFRVQLSDVAGNMTTQDLTVAIGCRWTPTAGDAAFFCDSMCYDLNGDETNCGACGNVCYDYCGCANGLCLTC